MSEAKIVGNPVLRAEGGDKVRGRTIYTADVELPGMLWAKILRSPYPHARIKSINTKRASLVPGVKAIITGVDTMDCLIGKQIRDMPVLCRNVVRFVGDRVAAVAAQTLDGAEEALALIEVDYEELPAVFNPMDAIQPDAPRLHENVAAYGDAPKDLLALGCSQWFDSVSLAQRRRGSWFSRCRCDFGAYI